MFETKRNKIIAAVVALAIIIIAVVTIVIINGNRQKDIDAGKAVIDRYYESYEKAENREAKLKVYNDLYKDQEVKDYTEKYNEVKEYLTSTETKIQDSSKKFFKDKFDSIEKVTIEEKDVTKVNTFNESINNLIKEVEDDKIISKENKDVLIEEFKTSLINMDEYYKKRLAEYEESYKTITEETKDETELVNKLNDLLASIDKENEVYKDIVSKIEGTINEHSKTTNSSNKNTNGSSRSNGGSNSSGQRNSGGSNGSSSGNGGSQGNGNPLYSNEYPKNLGNGWTQYGDGTCNKRTSVHYAIPHDETQRHWVIDGKIINVPPEILAIANGNKVTLTTFMGSDRSFWVHFGGSGNYSIGFGIDESYEYVYDKFEIYHNWITP